MDTIADMLSIIKNAQLAGQLEAELPYSKMKETLAKLLEKEGYLAGVRVFKPEGRSFRRLALALKYQDGSAAISHVRRISHPSRRVYFGKTRLPRALGNLGLVVVSTSRGLMSAKEARQKDLGGEVVAEIW